ncbi:hypothetical protein GCM10020295_04840 [Streptomyces cinereospinus]
MPQDGVAEPADRVPGGRMVTIAVGHLVHDAAPEAVARAGVSVARAGVSVARAGGVGRLGGGVVPAERRPGPGGRPTGRAGPPPEPAGGPPAAGPPFAPFAPATMASAAESGDGEESRPLSPAFSTRGEGASACPNATRRYAACTT